MASMISVNAKEYAYEQMKEDILKLKLVPGTKISEKIMSDQLEVSRTPIREAFLKLAQEELLTIIPQSGTFVSLIDLNLAEEARFVRETMEAKIVANCCETLTQETAFRLELNLKMQEQLISEDLGEEEMIRFLDLDEEFHRELFVCCGKERTWKMIQGMVGHLNRFRLLRLKDTNDLDWGILVSHHKEIYQAISEKNKQKAEELMSGHMRLMITEKDILLKKFPEYFRR